MERLLTVVWASLQVDTHYLYLLFGKMHSISIHITKKEEIDKVSDASDADGSKGEHHDEVS